MSFLFCKKRAPTILLVLLSLILLSSKGSNPSPRYFEITKNLDIFGTLFKELNTYYVDEIDPGKVIKRGIDAMLSGLDPYTVYIPEDQIEAYQIMTTGEYGGIGAVVEKMKVGVFLRKMYEDSPAVNGGLRVGDEVLKVDGVSVALKEMDEISRLLRGEADTQVVLTITRYGEAAPFEATLTRKRIKISSVPYYDMLGEEMGYIQLAEFSHHAGDSLRHALTQLVDRGMRQLILDLRNNPGGLLNEAISVSELFLPQETLVVSARGRVDKWNKRYYTNKAPVSVEMPLVVLVNEHTASAAEIVSGVVQDYDRGVIVGRRTLGKGLVQTSLPLSYNAQLRVTTARYYLPSGRCVQKINYSDSTEEEQEVETAPSFKTNGGRIMYEKKGISPDILSDRFASSKLTDDLLGGGYFFHYANQYYREHASDVPSLVGFSFSTIYEDFVSWVRAKGYRYKSQRAKHIDNMEALVRESKLAPASQAHWVALKEVLQAQQTDAWQVDREVIEYRLANEVLSRYYAHPKVVGYTLSRDPGLMLARDILEDEAAYQRVFSVEPDE